MRALAESSRLDCTRRSAALPSMGMNKRLAAASQCSMNWIDDWQGLCNFMPVASLLAPAPDWKVLAFANRLVLRHNHCEIRRQASRSTGLVHLACGCLEIERQLISLRVDVTAFRARSAALANRADDPATSPATHLVQSPPVLRLSASGFSLAILTRGGDNAR